jgi:chemotaxis protein methyltransferase CheR
LAERQLSLWCAAAASGQEPYSVALLLAEHFPHLVPWNVQGIASDLYHVLLERAQRGGYSQREVNRGLPAPLLRKYFQKNGSEWQLSEHIRRRVTFRHMNLIQAWPHLPPMDIIFM